MTYAALHDLVVRVAGALARLGLRAGQVAAIGHADIFEHAVLVTACEVLDVVAASFRTTEGMACHALLAAADVVLSAAPPAVDVRRHVPVGADWLAGAARLPPPPPHWLDPPPPAPGQVVTLVRTSGTTGRPKCVAITRAMLAARCRQRIDPYGLHADARVFAALHPSVHSVHVGIVGAWALGAAAVMEPRGALPLALAATAATHVTLLPYQLEACLDALPPGFRRLEALTVCIMGGRLPARLRAAATARLAGRCLAHYGAIEAGLVAMLDDDGAGEVVAGIEATCLGADGRAVPPGTEGRLAVRGPAVASGYAYAPALTAAHFRRGWFVTSDHAVMAAPGRLRVVGRDEEVVNLGGLKLACADLEDAARRRPGVRDAAILAGAADRAAEVVVAVVEAPAGDARPTAAQGVAPGGDGLLAVLAAAQWRVVPAIPRLANGKVDRVALRALVMS